MPKESVEISLRYEGRDVDDGSMSISDIVPVLQGFAGAYGKLASTYDPRAAHKIRITGVRSGSADIVLEVWRTLTDHADVIKGTGTIVGVAAGAGGAAIAIVRKIMGVMAVKKHAKRLPYKASVNVEAVNSIVLANADNTTIVVPLDVYELFNRGLVDQDLCKVVSPLREDGIEAVQIEARPFGSSERISERITVQERPYFDAGESSVATTQETWLVAKFNSLTKSTRSGYLNLADGSRVFYRYIPEEIHSLLQYFQLDESVRIRCVAHMDESLRPTLIDIHSIEPHQGDLFRKPPEG